MSNYLKTKAMKRLSIVGLMLASAFALTNCSQEIVPPIQENDVIVDESIKGDWFTPPQDGKGASGNGTGS